MATTLNELKQLLAERFQKGCQNGAEIIKENTPIDTQRLFETVRATDASINGSVVSCEIVLGGKELYGVRREQDIKKPVNYAKFVEMRYGFVRQSLGEVKQNIINNLEE